MRTLVLSLALLAATLASVYAASQPQPCEASIDALEAEMRSSMRSGTAERRDDLFAVIQRRIAERAPEASACTARLRNIEMTLAGKTDDLVRLDSILTSFFDGAQVATAPAWVTSRFYRQRGYLLERRGRLSESAQSYFEAAALAHEIDAINGARSLFDAAISAQDLRRKALTLAYVTEAEQLIADSMVTASPERKRALDVALGHAYSLRGGALYVFAESAATPNALTRVADDILEVDREARERLRSSPDAFDRTQLVYIAHRDALVLAETGAFDRARQVLAEAAQAQPSEGIPFLDVETLYTAGEVERLAGDLGAAEGFFVQAQEEAMRIEDRELEVQALERLGRVREQRGDLGAAESTYRHAVSLQEAQRERVGLREWSASVFDALQKPYRGLARVYLAQGAPDRALAVLDASHARAFRDLRRSRQARQTLSGERRTRVDALLDSLEAARLRSRSSGTATVPTSQTNAQIAAYEDRLADALGVEPLAAPPFDLALLQRRLGESGRNIVVYSIDGVQSTAYVVRADTLAAVPLAAGRERIAELVNRLVASWQRATPDPAANLAAAHALYAAVFAPVEALLSDGAPLTVVPDGALVHVPFGMLVRAPSESYREADYVVRHRAVATELAASLVADPGTPREARPLTALGVTTFGQASGSGTRNAAQAPLPYVAAEIERIAAHAGAGRVVLDDEATESAFGRLARDAGVVHLATHAILDPELPLNSHVVLRDDPAAADDGLLYVYELQNENLSADLVVLSGCSTAQGGLEYGEGLMGLGYAVRAAGAQASIATLWAVDDEATVFLMDRLYAGLADGLAKDEALRQAQLAYLDAHDGLAASPFYWAAPILSGTPVPIQLGSGPSWWLWAAALALVLGTVAWRFTHRRQDV